MIFIVTIDSLVFLFYSREDELVQLFIFRITREHRFEAMITDSGTRLTEGGSKIMGDGYKGINSKYQSTNGGSQILYTWSLNGRQSEIRTVNWVHI